MAVFIAPAFGQGDLLIFPKRLVFEGTQNRVQALNLNNSGNDTTTYRISYIEHRLEEDGKFVQIEEPDQGQQFASPYLRFFPRTITLAPKETQVIKVQLTRTGNLEPGEYRSHLYFRSVPKPQPLQENSEEQMNSENISIELRPVYGISIANIIRIGEPEVQVDLKNLAFEKFNDAVPVVSMEFHRTGSASSYGDILVKYVSPEGKETVVARMKGFAVYTPGNLRRARIQLEQTEGVDYSSGHLKVLYGPQDKNKKDYAEASLSL